MQTNPNIASVITLTGKLLRALFNIGLLIFIINFLTPEQMGTFALLVTIQMLFNPFCDSGFLNIFVKYSRNDLFTDLSYYSNVAGIILSLLFVVVASISTLVVGIELRIPYAALFSVCIYLSVQSSFHKAFLLSKHEYSLVNIVETIASLTGVISAVTIIYFYQSIYALILRYLVEYVLLYFAFAINTHSPRRKHFKFKFFKLTQDEYRYMLGVISGRILLGFLQSLDRVLVGFITNTATFGAYFYFKNILTAPDQFIRTSLTGPATVFIASLSNSELQKFLHTTIIKIVTVVIAPIIVISQCGQFFVASWISKEWAVFLWMIPPLCFFAISLSIKAISSLILVNAKKTRYWNIYISGEYAILILCFTFAVMHSEALQITKYTEIYSYAAFTYWIVITLYILSVHLPKYFLRLVIECSFISLFASLFGFLLLDVQFLNTD